MEEIMRLDKFFSSQSLASRKEVKDFVKKGLVTINNKPCKKSDEKINPSTDIIKLNGKAIDYQKHVYIMLNKPKGVVSATNDRSQKTVIDLVPEHLKRANLFPAGRLDKDTTGFVLITDDGETAHKILAPKSHVDKVYVATIDGFINDEHIDYFKDGVTLKDGFTCLPAQIRELERFEDSSNVEVILCEGKYHQIKRMFASIGLFVMELKRIKMGGIDLDPNLEEGECKGILYKDVERFLLAYSEEKLENRKNRS